MKTLISTMNQNYFLSIESIFIVCYGPTCKMMDYNNMLVSNNILWLYYLTLSLRQDLNMHATLMF